MIGVVTLMPNASRLLMHMALEDRLGYKSDSNIEMRTGTVQGRAGGMEWSLMRKRCMIGVTGADITAAEVGHGVHTTITEVAMIETVDKERMTTDVEAEIQTGDIEAETGARGVMEPEKRAGLEIEIGGTTDMTTIDDGNMRRHPTVGDVSAFRQNTVLD